jgi:GTPase SAR1 family protein
MVKLKSKEKQMRYKRYSEEELKELALIPDGIYQFETMEVHETDKYHNPLRDKNGYDMAKLKLKIWDKNGRERFVFTNLFGDGNMSFRTRHYADSIGKIQQYEDETFEIRETLGDSGYCQIITRKGGIKNIITGEKWNDSNDVKDFIKLEDQKQYHNPKTESDMCSFDDDIPNL